MTAQLQRKEVSKLLTVFGRFQDESQRWASYLPVVEWRVTPLRTTPILMSEELTIEDCSDITYYKSLL